MVVTRDGHVSRAVRLLRNQGQERRYENEVVGLNNRMTDVHAAIGRVQLAALASRTARRQANAHFFDTHLVGVKCPTVDARATHAYHLYTIRIEGHDRDRFAQEMEKRGVGSGVYYPIPVHRLPAYSQDLDLPETDQAAREVLSLPVHPSLTEEDLHHIASAVDEVARAGS